MTEYDDVEQVLRRFRPVGPSSSMRAPAELTTPPPGLSPSWLAITGGGLVVAASLALLFWSRPFAANLVETRPAGDTPAGSAQLPGELRAFNLEWANKPRINFGLPLGGAQVLMLEFVDWLCPAEACGPSAARQIAERYAVTDPGAVRHVIGDFPINAECNPAVSRTVPGHEASCVAAAAVRLARTREGDRAMSRWLIEHRSEIAGLAPSEAIAAVKTETARLLGSAAPSDADYATEIGRIRRETAVAASLGVTSVPKLYVNGAAAGSESGVPWPAEYVERAVESERARATATAASTQDFDAPIRIGGDMPAVSRTRYVLPAYPRDPRRGIVAIIELTVDPAGRVNSANVLRGPQGDAITTAAVEAVEQWEYEPLELGGEPVWFVQTVVVSFP